MKGMESLDIIKVIYSTVGSWGESSQFCGSAIGEKCDIEESIGIENEVKRAGENFVTQ